MFYVGCRLFFYQISLSVGFMLLVYQIHIFILNLCFYIEFYQSYVFMLHLCFFSTKLRFKLMLKTMLYSRIIRLWFLLLPPPLKYYIIMLKNFELCLLLSIYAILFELCPMNIVRSDLFIWNFARFLPPSLTWTVFSKRSRDWRATVEKYHTVGHRCGPTPQSVDALRPATDDRSQTRRPTDWRRHDLHKQTKSPQINK